MKKTTLVFDHLDNVLANYADGDATILDIAMAAKKVNQYLIENPHPHDLHINEEKDDNENSLWFMLGVFVGAMSLLIAIAILCAFEVVCIS